MRNPKISATKSSYLYSSQFFLLAIAYFLTGKLGLEMAHVGSHITLIWLPTGIAVAALYRWSESYWPSVYCGSLLVNLTAQMAWPQALLVGVFNTLAPLLVVKLLKRSKHGLLSSTKGVRWLCLSTLIGMLISSSGGTITLFLFGNISFNDISKAWLSWWLGDSVGALLATPLLLSINNGTVKDIWLRYGEFLLWLITAFAIGLLIFFYNDGAQSHSLVLIFLSLPIIFWAAMNLGLTGGAMVTLLLSLVSVLSIANGVGPFNRTDVNESMLLWWSYATCITLVGLFINALQAERTNAIKQLNKVNAELDHNLVDRTCRLMVQNTIMDQVIRREPLQVIFTNLIDQIEAHNPGLVCAILAGENNYLGTAAKLIISDDIIKFVRVNNSNTDTTKLALFQTIGEVTKIMDISQAPDCKAFSQHSGISTLCLEPIPIAAPAFAILLICLSQPRTPTESELEWMTASARLAGLAIDRFSADFTMKNSQSMIESIRQVQMHFITEPNPRKAFDALLKVLLDLTQSEYGFIGEILYESNGTPYLKTYAITNIAWNEETNKFFKENAPQGMEFRNLNSLFGATITSRQPVYANNPANDPRAGGLPPGHPAMHTFAGLPFFHGKEMIGMVGIANRPSGYDEKLNHWLAPFLATCSNLIAGYRAHRQRLEAEFQVVQAHDHLNATLTAIPDLLFEVNEQGIHLDFRAKQNDLLYVRPEQFLGKSLEQVLPAEVAEIIHQAIDEARIKGYSLGFQYCLALSGKNYWFELSVARKPLGNNKFTFILLARDITSRKKIEQELREKNAELERFIYMISHDLKSPLVTIKTFLGYLAEDIAKSDKARITKDMDFMVSAADKMGMLLEDLLKLARIGRKASVLASTDYNQLIVDVISMLEGTLDKKSVKIQVDSVDLILIGDRSELIQIWQNLIENALKYMGDRLDPMIEIGVQVNANQPVFFVRDNGIGIEPCYHNKVFDIFEKLDAQSEGSGLGLALVKRIVELYHGTIKIESDGPDHGCTFLFTLPDAVKKATENHNAR